MLVAKAVWTWATEPLKVTNVPPLATPATVKPLAGEPGRHLGQVGAAEAELGSVLLRRQPLVVARRCGVLLVGEQLVDRGLLRGAGREA